ncbi:unnamed protein product [Cuscuta epithymum]|uniref:Glucosamine/galactosamine-6-phosphate isomerase domain-containing protein n=1 Tax=Cuscuta epithymum TaxID=186058 RepID=A0AAV0EJM3_9ASTE|nr:unnamed protein product [Cuscuta epithymum]
MPVASSKQLLSANVRISHFVPLALNSSLASPLSCSICPKSLSLAEKEVRVFTKASMADFATGERKAKVKVFDSEDELKASLAKYTADLSEKFCAERGSFSVVFSGGSLIKCLGKLLEPPYVDSVHWSKWHIFWVDERVVPKDHPDSNYLLAYDSFLSKIPIPAGNVYAINEALSAEGAASGGSTAVQKCSTEHLKFSKHNTLYSW